MLAFPLLFFPFEWCSLNPSQPVCASTLRFRLSRRSMPSSSFPSFPQFLSQVKTRKKLFPPLSHPFNPSGRGDNKSKKQRRRQTGDREVMRATGMSLIIPVRPSTRVTLTSLTGALELDSILIDVCLCGEGKERGDANRRSPCG